MQLMQRKKSSCTLAHTLSLGALESLRLPLPLLLGRGGHPNSSPDLLVPETDRCLLLGRGAMPSFRRTPQGDMDASSSQNAHWNASYDSACHVPRYDVTVVAFNFFGPLFASLLHQGDHSHPPPPFILLLFYFHFLFIPQLHLPFSFSPTLSL